MPKKSHKSIGILGGMGPEATAHFYWLIIKNTKASKDQEHIHVLIDSYPEIPPRTDAILGQGPSPLPYLIKSARRLLSAGADILVMPCITAHYYFEPLTSKIRLPFVNLVQATIEEAQRIVPPVKKIGIIASTGTVRSGLFHQYLEKVGIKPLCPRESEQAQVMEAIFGQKGIKAGITSGKPRQLILNVASKLIRREAEAIIAGCTEIPLVLKANDISVPLLEPMEIGARTCIQLAGYELKSQPSSKLIHLFKNNTKMKPY